MKKIIIKKKGGKKENGYCSKLILNSGSWCIKVITENKFESEDFFMRMGLAGVAFLISEVGIEKEICFEEVFDQHSVQSLSCRRSTNPKENTNVKMELKSW